MTALTRAQADAQCTALLDARLVSKLPLYTGEQQAWKRWSFKIAGHIDQNAPSLAAALDSTVASIDPVEHRRMSPLEVALDQGIYHLLTLLFNKQAADELKPAKLMHQLESIEKAIQRQHQFTCCAVQLPFFGGCVAF